MQIPIYRTVLIKQQSIVGEGFNPPGQLKTVLRLVSTVVGGVTPPLRKCGVPFVKDNF